MIKFRSLVLFIVIILVYNTCTKVTTTKKPMQLLAFNSMERIDQSGKASGKTEINIKAAKNEWESFQVAVTAIDTNLKISKVEISDLIGDNNIKIEKENFTFYKIEHVQVRLSSPRTNMPPGLYADPLIPFINPVTGDAVEPYKRARIKGGKWGDPMVESGSYIYSLPFEVANGHHQIIWIDVFIPKTALAGDYFGKLKISAGRDLIEEMPVTLTVWDFTLPDKASHRNSFGNFSQIPRYFPDVTADSEEFREIEMRFCEELAKHRLNPPIPDYLLPQVNKDGSLTIIPEKHKALTNFIQRTNLADFRIPKSTFATLPRRITDSNYATISADEKHKAIRYYREYYQYLKDNGWEKRAYLYLWDEPNLKENYEQVLVLGALVREASSDIKILVVEPPVPDQPDWPDMDPVVDIWCPLWPLLEKVKDSINAKIAMGDEVWSYTALVQGSDEFRAPYWHIDRPLAVYRVPTWMNWQYKITGLLYWSTFTGGTMVDPWWNPAFRNRYNGGGYLFYPGTLCGINGPVTSMRLKVIRDSMEDYEYFEILKNLTDRETVNEIINEITTKYWIYSENPEDYYKAREKLANAILNAKK